MIHARKNPTVLIADDEEFFRMSVREALEARGVRAIEVANGRDALTVLGSQTIDCVVTDLAMPGLSGEGLLGEMLVHRHRMPVVVVSAFAEPGVKLTDGPEIFAKPVDLYALCDTVSHLIAEGERSLVTLTGLLCVLVVVSGRCRIEVEVEGKRDGELTVSSGQLASARAVATDGTVLSGVDAALEILSWQPSTLAIESGRGRRLTPDAETGVSFDNLLAHHRARRRNLSTG